MEKKIANHSFTFNPKDNGGEAVSLITEYFKNGDGTIFTNQKICAECYGIFVSELQLYGVSITPDILRKLANDHKIGV